ncbi:MAG TPA: nuclear transport factor 2 family protein [Mycobacteriales bacterium]|nr:nuclear transport factor 2 family protein [Mycobacteriales bacterium]
MTDAQSDAVAELAAQVREALAAADLERFADLLDPNVTWGAPGDAAPACRNRSQVLRWYAQGRADGRRARVLDVTTHRDKILVSMLVSDRDPADDDADAPRWQVLTVVDGRVADIRGYDDEATARAAVYQRL